MPNILAMVRVLGCIFQQHDLRLVLLAAGLCVLACATALSMISRARAADAGRPRQIWLAGAGAVAGCGIWATHFVAMLAYHTGMPIAFDAGLTALSAAIRHDPVRRRLRAGAVGGRRGGRCGYRRCHHHHALCRDGGGPASGPRGLGYPVCRRVRF